MKTILFFVCIVAVSNGAPQFNPANSAGAILRYAFDNIGVGAYKFGYEAGDGSVREEEAVLENEGQEDEALVVKGSYKYIDSNGETNVVSYTADKDGYHPEGANLVPSAGVKRTKPLGIPSAALASLAG